MQLSSRDISVVNQAFETMRQELSNQSEAIGKLTPERDSAYRESMTELLKALTSIEACIPPFTPASDTVVITDHTLHQWIVATRGAARFLEDGPQHRAARGLNLLADSMQEAREADREV